SFRVCNSRQVSGVQQRAERCDDLHHFHLRRVWQIKRFQGEIFEIAPFRLAIGRYQNRLAVHWFPQRSCLQCKDIHCIEDVEIIDVEFLPIEAAEVWIENDVEPCRLSESFKECVCAFCQIKRDSTCCSHIEHGVRRR